MGVGDQKRLRAIAGPVLAQPVSHPPSPDEIPKMASNLIYERVPHGDRLSSGSPSPLSPAPGSRLQKSRPIDRLLDTLGVTGSREREAFEEQMLRQARQLLTPEQAESAITRGFAFHAALVDPALGIVHAIHGMPDLANEVPPEFDITAFAFGFARLQGWTRRRTRLPLGHAALLVLTAAQRRLLLEVIQAD